MNKYIGFIVFAIISVFSFSLISCGGDDDDVFEQEESKSQLVINGKLYNISFEQTGVLWLDIPANSVIQFGTGKDGILSAEGKIYTFGFPAWDGEKYIDPKVGLDISKLRYEITEIGALISSLTLGDDDDIKCDYVSGSLIITEINKSQEYMVLRFNDLKMSNGRISYTFSGTLKLPFHI